VLPALNTIDRSAKRVLRRAAGAVALAASACVLAASSEDSGSAPDHPTAEFSFTRLVYSDAAGGFGFRGRFREGHWLVDYPDSEIHFRQGVRRLTRVQVADNDVMLALTDDRIFDYPWLYAVEVGHWYLDDTEAARLHEYLTRGGFLMVDDFHGTREWSVFLDSIKRVFPDRPIVDIGDDDEVLHDVYDLNERIQIPGIRALMMGRTYEYDGYKPEWKGIYDDDGRLMVAINHNMDMGDAWELADNPSYPEPMTALAYRFAVNYVIYSMTH
jgi:hypothetical protein